MSTIQKWFAGITVIMLALFLAACSSSDDSKPPAASTGAGYTYEFEDAGSVFTVTVGSSSFSGSGGGDSASGTVTRLSNGIALIKTTASSNPADVNTVMYAVEIPGGLLFVVSARDNTGTLIVDSIQGSSFVDMDVGVATGGSCAAVANGDVFNAMVTIDESTYSEATSAAWATAAVTPGTTGLMLTLTDRTLAEDFQAVSLTPTVVDNLTCSGDTLSNGTDEVIFTPSGLGMVRLAGGSGYILAPIPTGLTEQDIEAAGRAYAGLSMQPYDGSDLPGEPVGGGIDGMKASMIDSYGNFNLQSGSLSTLTGRMFVDVENGDFDPITILIDGGASTGSPPPDGLADSTVVDVGVTNSPARFIVHKMPDGKLALMGLNDFDLGTGDPLGWEYIILMQNGPAVTVPDFSGVTGSNTYIINEDDGAGNPETILLEIDYTTNNEWWAWSDNGQLMWGSVSKLSNGFLSVTQAGATSPRDREGLPFTFPAFEIPGTMLQLFFSDTGSGINEGVTGFVSGVCPAGGPYDYNMIYAPHGTNYELDEAAGGDEEFYGDGFLGEAAGVYTLTPNATWKLIFDGTPFTEPGPLGSGSCTGGTVTWGTTEMFIFPNGMRYMEDTAATAGGIVLLPQSAITPKTTAVEYRGWVENLRYDTNATTWKMEVSPIFARSNGTAGQLSAGPYNNVLTNSENSAEGGILQLSTSSLPTGLDGAGLVDPAGAADPFRYMVMADTSNGSKHVIVGVFHEAVTVPLTDNRSDWSLLFLMEQ